MGQVEDRKPTLEEASKVENKTEEVDDKNKKVDKNKTDLEKATSNEGDIVIDNIDTSAKETVIGSEDRLATITASLFWPPCSMFPHLIKVSRSAKGPKATG